MDKNRNVHINENIYKQFTRILFNKRKISLKQKKEGYNKIKEKKYYINNNNLFSNPILSLILMFLFFLFFPFCFVKEVKIRSLVSSYEITVKVNGIGNQTILGNDSPMPNRLYLNYNNESLLGEKTLYNLESNENIVTIVWDNPVTSCYGMFYGLTNIEEVDLSNFDSSGVTDISSMFQECTNLKYINFTNFDSHLLTNLNHVFFNCFSLQSLDLRSFNTESVTSMFQTFYCCRSLSSLDISSFNTSSVETMFQMFFECAILKSLDLSNFDTSSVTNMFEMFLNCFELESINLNSFNTKLVTDMGQMFYDCHALKSLNLSNFDTSSVNSMFEMFSGCNSLKSLDLSNFNTPSLTNMESMFKNCIQLESLDISNFDTSNVNNMKNLFQYCNSLKSLNLSNFDTSNVPSFENMFDGCRQLEILDIDNFDSSSVLSLNYMFSDCQLLKSLDLTKFLTSNVQSANHMFYNCFALTSLELGNFDTSSINDMSYMFSNCQSLISLNLNSFSTGSLTLYEGIFNNLNGALIYCVNDIMSEEIKSLLSISHSEKNCSDLCSDISGSKYIIEKNICIDNCQHDDSFIFEYDSICFRACPNRTHLVDNYICENDLICEKYYNYEKTGCLDSIPLGYYINDTIEKTIDKCDIKCSNCTKESMENELCISCNNNEGYYEKGNDELNENIFIHCYNGEIEGYYLDEDEQIYNPCFPTCKACSGSGNNENHNCVECISNYALNSGNCETIVEEDTYNTDTNNPDTTIFSDENDSTESQSNTEETTHNSEANEGQMSDTSFSTDENTQSDPSNVNDGTNSNSVSSDTNRKETDTTSDIESTQTQTDSSGTAKETTETSNYSEETTQSDSNSSTEETNSNSASTAEETTKTSKIYDLEYLDRENYSYPIDSNINDLKKKFKNYTFLEILPEEIDLIYDQFGLDRENDKLNVYIDNFISNDPKMAINDYSYKFILENGTELNLNNVKEEILINCFVPINDFELANYNYSQYFYGQGYDIYDKDNNFYNDFCSSAHLGENDITLADRRKYIYPNNVTLCKNNCEYKGVEREDKRIICSCHINENIKKNKENYFKEEDDGNFLSYILDNINYKIFNCYNLISSFDNLKNNYAFYTILGVYFVFLCLNLIFYCYTLPSMKKEMIIEAPTPIKVRQKIIQELLRLRRNTGLNLLNPIKKRGKHKKSKTTLKKQSAEYFLSSNSSNKNLTRSIVVIKKKTRSSKFNIKKKTVINQYTSIQNFISGPMEKKISDEEKQKENKATLEENQVVENSENNENNPKYSNQDINEFPFTKAIKNDNRNILQMFYSFLIIKLELINIFCTKSKIKILLIEEYILFLLFNFFINTLLYSDEVVSNKYHNNGELDIFVTIFLSLLSNLITSIICYYIKCSKGIDERTDLIKEIKRKKYYLCNVIKFFKYLRIKFIFFFISEIIIVSICYYYIVIFCIVYKRSKESLIINYLTSLFEEIIIAVAITLAILITRKIGLSCFNKHLYNTSKYINYKF